MMDPSLSNSTLMDQLNAPEDMKDSSPCTLCLSSLACLTSRPTLVGLHCKTRVYFGSLTYTYVTKMLMNMKVHVHFGFAHMLKRFKIQIFDDTMDPSQ